MEAARASVRHDVESFAHTAFFYDNEEAYVSGAAAFLAEGAHRGEPMLVAVSSRKIGLLRDALGDDAVHVKFLDMAELGANPARIIPAWREFASKAGDDTAVRGIGEPIWAERSPAELAESELHEALLNVAFADRPAFELLCPYDLEALHPKVIEHARRTHPLLADGPISSSRTASDDYIGLAGSASPAAAPPLAPPPVAVAALPINPSTLMSVRTFVRRQATEHGLAGSRLDDLVLAVNELATNTIRYGGGEGTACLWREGATLYCEVTDGGRLTDPLAGRYPPPVAAEGGRGLWLVNQLCDLAQVRTVPSGTVVRLHMHL
jgi:anti-sigma regulatory factor (Ser/Thr protein kinase)